LSAAASGTLLELRGDLKMRIAFLATSLFVAMGFLPVSAPAADWGDLTGKFVYDGPPPQPKKVDVTKDVEVFGNLNITDESLVVGKDGGIANVVVYLRTTGVAINPELATSVKPKVEYDNKGGRFVPHILPLWYEKQTIVLKNSDPVGHNSNVQPLGDTGINPLLPANGSVDHKFNRKQTLPIPVGCNIHPWMRGYVLPRDNPYFAVTGEDGSFKIEKLPAGAELEFQVWQEKSGYLVTPKTPMGRLKVAIKPGANDIGTIKVDPKVFNK
jgi:hypothetical protein